MSGATIYAYSAYSGVQIILASPYFIMSKETVKGGKAKKVLTKATLRCRVDYGQSKEEAEKLAVFSASKTILRTGKIVP